MSVGVAILLVGVVGLALDDGTDAAEKPVTTTAPAPTSTIAPPTSSTAELPAESAADFVIAVLQAIADRDSAFLLARLADATFERYGTEQCERFFSNLEDPTERFEVRAVGDSGPFEYVTDGVSRTIENAVPVEIARVINGQTALQEQHVTRTADGTFRFYSDCGEPIEGAR